MTETWLLIETSSRVGKLGLARGDSASLAGRASDGVSVPSLARPANKIQIVRSVRLEETRRLARDLATTVGSMLDAESLRPKDVTGVIVSIGPGSYTGLRVGITSAKAFAYATGCRLVAVPTFAAIALQAPIGEAWVIADALQGLVYLQRFQQGERVDELRIERAEDVLPSVPAGVWFTGPGVAAHAAYLPDNAQVVPEADREPTVESLLLAGLALTPATREDMFALEPLYLRGSSAEEKAKGAGKK